MAADGGEKSAGDRPADLIRIHYRAAAMQFILRRLNTATRFMRQRDSWRAPGGAIAALGEGRFGSSSGGRRNHFPNNGSGAMGFPSALPCVRSEVGHAHSGRRVGFADHCRSRLIAGLL
jgi:hypothetical protein